MLSTKASAEPQSPTECPPYPAYQASIDTLRHSITSRKILYTTFWFLSIPFGKIIGKIKKKTYRFLGLLHVLFIFGNSFILLQLFLNACFRAAERRAPPRLTGRLEGSLLTPPRRGVVKLSLHPRGAARRRFWAPKGRGGEI